jgi:hypothetical protein
MQMQRKIVDFFQFLSCLRSLFKIRDLGLSFLKDLKTS